MNQGDYPGREGKAGHCKYGGQFTQKPNGGRKHGGVVGLKEGLCVWSV